MGSDAVALLAGHLDAEAVEDVRAYFAVGDDGLPRYTGARFESLDGGGDRDEVANRFTPADIVAVKFLSVEIPHRTALWLVEPNDAVEALLSKIPHCVDPADETAARQLTDEGSEAQALWELLEEAKGLGWVTVGKLMARKRPHLIPVYDSVVRQAVGAPESWWKTVAEFFSNDDHLRRLDEIKNEAAAPAHVSRLRILDIAIWMRHRGRFTG